MKEQFEQYEVEGFFDETFAREDHSIRSMYQETAEYFGGLSDDRMKSSLRSLESDPDPLVREAARQALLFIGPGEEALLRP